MPIRHHSCWYLIRRRSTRWCGVPVPAGFLQLRENAGSWLACGILPGLEKIHGDNKDDAASMSHNLEFYNTHHSQVTFCYGCSTPLSRTSWISQPFVQSAFLQWASGGIGDALFWFTLVPITAGITSNMAISGNVFAPFLFLSSSTSRLRYVIG